MIYVMIQLAINCLVSYFLDLMSRSNSALWNAIGRSGSQDRIWADRERIVAGICPRGLTKTYTPYPALRDVNSKVLKKMGRVIKVIGSVNLTNIIRWNSAYYLQKYMGDASMPGD